MKSKTMFKKFLYLSSLIFVLFLLPAISYAAPKIFYTDIVSGPNTGGENNNGAYLSVFGKDFGNNINNVKVYVGNGEVARYIYLGSSLGRPDVQQLSVQLGPNTSTGTIRVVVNGVESNTDHTFTVRAGNFYYVSLTGNDSTGVVNDINRPFRTPNYLLRTLTAVGPGDFIVIRGGTYVLEDGTNNLYNRNWMRPTKSGVPGSPITIYGYPGETIIARKDSGQSSVYGAYERVHDLVIANFKGLINFCDVSQSTQIFGTGGAQDSCSTSWSTWYTYDSRIVNLDFSGGCAGKGSSHFTVSATHDLKIYGISIHDSADGGGAPTSHPLYLGDQMYNVDVGWVALYNLYRTRGVLQIHHDSFSGTCDFKALTDIFVHDSIFYSLNGQPILVDGSTGDIYIYNNLLYHSMYAPIPPFQYDDIIVLRGSGGNLHAYIYNNTIYANPNPGAAGYLLSFGSIVGGHTVAATIYNNIFVVTESQDKYYGFNNGNQTNSTITSDYNIWYGSSSGLPSFAGANDRNMDPQFISPAGNDFRLKPTSPAIDKGAMPKEVSKVVTRDFDGNVRPQGAGYDIGAYEYIKK